MLAAIPAVAAVGARVSNDALLLPLAALGALAATGLLEQPSPRRAAIMGAIAAAAVLTKASGLVLLVLAAVTVGVLWSRGRRSWLTAGLALGPGIAAAVVWTAWTYRTYGVLVGSDAFLAVVRPFTPLPGPAFLQALWLQTWDSYWHAYGVRGILRALPAIWWALVLAALLSAVRRRESRPHLALAGTLLLGLLAVLWLGNVDGLFHPRGRFLAPAYPAVAALVAGGWARLIPGWGPAVPAIAAWASAAGYVAFWLLPFFES